jgi:hypothetical protein
MTAENTPQKQRGRPFAKGHSGNPAGRPRGARNKATMAVEALLHGEADAITRKAIERAKEGDAAALRLCLERIIPARKDRHVSFSLPPLNCAADSTAVLSKIVQAVSGGELMPSEGVEVAKLVESYVRSVAITDLEARLKKLEGGQQQ